MDIQALTILGIQELNKKAEDLSSTYYQREERVAHTILSGQRFSGGSVLWRGVK